MKRLLLLVFGIFFLCGFTFAQKIETDKTDESGFRVISTDLKVCRDFSDKTVFSFGVNCYTNGERTDYVLNVKIGCKAGNSVSKGARVLIKTFKGEVIQATVDADGEAELLTLKLAGNDFDTYNLYAPITLTSEQIHKIAADGIQKIRIEGSPENYEKEYKKDKTSKAISERLDLVDKALAKKASSFSDGF